MNNQPIYDSLDSDDRTNPEDSSHSILSRKPERVSVSKNGRMNSKY